MHVFRRDKVLITYSFQLFSPDCKEAETTTTRSRSNDEKTNKQNTKDEDVSPVGKILIASNVIVAAAICVVIGCIIKQKYYNK